MANSATETKLSVNDLLLILASILLPPLAVALKRGIGWPFVLNILLTVLGYVPGLVHAIWIVARS
ncbi:MAG: YqaE/Pmp3 family membrane protein [Pseudomonadota bacterium]